MLAILPKNTNIVDARQQTLGVWQSMAVFKRFLIMLFLTVKNVRQSASG